MASNLGSSEEKTNGTKLRRLLVDGGTPALREVFESFIHPPSTLQTMLNNNWATLDNLKKENVLNDRQWKKLFPPSGGPPDSKTFDITLLHLLLREICPTLTTPRTGWHSMPAKKDHSRGAEIVRIKCFRNRLCHGVSTAVPNKEFEDEWKTISLSLVNLGIDRQEINRLKTENIDHDTQQRIEEEVKKWKLDIEPRVQTLEHEVQQLKAGQISSNEQSRKRKHLLPDRSLVEETKRAKEEPKRYRLHSLIKAFVKNVDPSAAPVLAKGEKAACAHYMSRLADNADYYWGNDTCKQSLDSFKEDRHNFEHFLKVFTQWRGSESDVAMKSCEAFFVNLPQKCMYLEMCVRPRDYTDFLQQLLKANDPKLHPVHKVELLCLLGHEKRKVGEGIEYEDCMKEAEELYLKYKTNFKESPLSEVIYLNSHARLLVEKKIPDKPKEVYDKALKICEQKLPDHPERVATFSLAGTNAKRQKEYKQAEELLNQALALSKKCLGEHVMTAHRFKGIADLLFCSPGKRGFNAVLSKYEESLAVLKHLGRDDHKETILTLKNCASCHSSNGNYEEARKFLDRAESIADTELEKDHMWKVRVKTEQALVFDKENKEDKMIEAMKNGLEMCHRLGKTIEDLGNKYEIRKVLNRHPEKFPKDKYPRWKE